MQKILFKPKRYLLYSYFAVIIIFLSFSIYFYITEEKNEKKRNRINLETIAKIKSSEIKSWYNERTSDARFLYSSSFLRQILPNYNSKTDSQKVASFIASIFKNHDYKNIFIIDENKKCVFYEDPLTKNIYYIDSLNSSLKNNEIKFSNFYIDPIDSKIDLDIYVPLIGKDIPSSVIILKIDPERILFPVIQNWYSPNSSIESFIVIRQADSIVFVNKLKFRETSALLSFKLPAFNRDLPAAMAVSGIEKVVEGTDYRGKKVLADIRSIGKTPWYLITKQDLSEIYLPVSNRLSYILLFLFSIPAIGGLTFLYFQSRQNYHNSLKINESTKKFELLFQSSNDGILIIEDGKVVNCNLKTEKIFELTEKDLANKSLIDYSPYLQPNGRNSEDKLKTIMNNVAAGNTQLFEWLFVINGRQFHCEINMFPLRMNEKNYIVAIVRDATERKKIEEQNLMLLFAIEQSPSSIVMTDVEGKIEYVNPKFSKVTGYAFDEVLGKNPRILKSGELSHEVYKKLWETITSGKEWRGEFHNKKKNKELYWEMASISPVKNAYGEITHFIAIKEDITEAKGTQDFVKKMTEDLILQNKYLEQFAYIISHNLRSPVANIVGIANALNEFDLPEPEKKAMMEGLSISVKKLDEVIIDLNDILQIKRGIDEIKERVSFSRLLDDITESISGLIEKKKVEIKSDFSEVDEILTLKSYLRSIFYNLISNSIKYNQQGIPPIIEIKSKRRGSEIELTFSDNGLGIDLNKKGDQVFGLYKRFHDHMEGKGLGLFMTKMQVEALNGKINISSEVNKGTEFKIVFDN